MSGHFLASGAARWASLTHATNAAAGIGWYLRVEQPHDSVELHLERLAGDHYIPAMVASPGQALVTEEPFPFELEIASLLRRRHRD